MPFTVKRIYEPVAPADGYRVLVDRLWPRGLKKEDAALDAWARELAPSSALRKWFGNDAMRWESFRHRYATELDAVAGFWRPLVDQAARHPVTLLFASRNEELNSAVALKAYLDIWLRARDPLSGYGGR